MDGRRTLPVLLRALSTALVMTLASSLASCAAHKTFIHLKGGTPDALVTMNDRYLGPLERLGKGIRVEEGTYRITVEKDGYFPFDALVQVSETPVDVPIELTRIPE